MATTRSTSTLVHLWLGAALALLTAVTIGCSSAESEPTATTAEATTTTTTTVTTTDVPDTTSATRPPSTLVWEPCGRAECATLAVPLDHDDPSQGMIDLEVARWPSQRPEERIGVLLYNPGGPGAPGTPLVMDEVGWLFSSTLLDHFDVVSWDPRGVSEAARVDCVDNPGELLLHDPTPETTEEEALIEAAIAEYVAGCVERSGELLPHLSTMANARDMDLLREALGEEQISYLGVSYGTALGSVYATLFPERVRAMVLDSAIDLSAPLADWMVPRAEALERALTLMLQECAADSACPFHNDGEPFVAFDDLMVRLDAEPLVADDTEVGVADAMFAVFWGLLWERDWWDLTRALAEAQDGNGRLLRNLNAGLDEIIESLHAIECRNWPRGDWEPSQSTIDALLEVAPRLGLFPLADAAVDLCSVWPAEPDPPPPLTGVGAGPILVIGSTGDIATPLQSSRDLAERLEEGVLLVVEANDHGAYWISPDTLCVVETVDRYLTNFELPANESRCIPGDPQLHSPD